eukprot:1942477-Ditylum_brightwellii.AAC.1
MYYYLFFGQAKLINAAAARPNLSVQVTRMGIRICHLRLLGLDLLSHELVHTNIFVDIDIGYCLAAATPFSIWLSTCCPLLALRCVVGVRSTPIFFA